MPLSREAEAAVVTVSHMHIPDPQPSQSDGQPLTFNTLPGPGMCPLLVPSERKYMFHGVGKIVTLS